MTRARSIADLLDASGLIKPTKTHSITINGTSIALGGSADIGLTWENKSSDFTAEVNKAYNINTSAQSVTATLPTSATTGDEVRFLDATGSFDTHGLAIMRNGHRIQGVEDNLSVTTERAGFSLVYYDANNGWLLMEK